MSAKKGRQALDEDDHALWQQITRSVTPLPKRRPRPAEPQMHAARTSRTEERASAVGAPGAAAPAPAHPPALASLEPRLRRRLARGRAALDGCIDLHGCTQAQAYRVLLGFLRSAQAKRAKVVLVITGKGGRENDEERGVLRREVPRWLRLPEFHPLVVGCEPAAIRHGGEGALYVRLRKQGDR